MTMHRLPLTHSDAPAIVGTASVLAPGQVEQIAPNGLLRVRLDEQHDVICEALNNVEPMVGDRVLVAQGAGWACVLGLLGTSRPANEVRVVAGQALTLSCGEASLTLRADGKVLIKGDDVVLRAKGTQRIRAGNVAIN